MVSWLSRLVARVPATVHTKLSTAFLTIVVLLIIVGAVALAALNEGNRRAEELARLQRNIAAYQQLQHDSTAHLHSITSALLVPEERTLETALRQLNQFAYNVDRLHVIAKDDLELIRSVREDYEQFVDVATEVVALIRAGKADEGRELHLAKAGPLADRLERSMNELVNKAEADIVTSVEASREAYSVSRRTVIAFAVGSVALALVLGFAISWSLIGPVKQMNARFREIAAGDFSKRVEVHNRDEFGALAVNLNNMNDELGRLYEQIETRNRELTAALDQQTATGEVLQVISSSPTASQPVFETIVSNAARLCEANFAVVLLYDGERFSVAAHTDISREFAEYFAQGYPVDRQTATGRAALERKPVQIVDILADSEFCVTPAHRSEHVRTVLAAPMLRDEVLVGAIAIWRREVRAFTEQQTKLLQTFAAQAVIAIDNVRLFQQLQARTRELGRSVEELKALGEVGRTLSSTLDLPTVLTTIVSRAAELSGSQGGVIYEFNETTKTFHVIATHHTAQEYLEALQAMPVRLGEGAIGLAGAIQSSVQVSDILDEHEPVAPQVRHILARLGFRSLLALPLLRERRLLGGLVVWRQEPGRFTNEIVTLLQTFAAQSVIAIENARLFQEIQDKSRDLETASQHKSQFLANMSHELRTPLNAIIGFSEVLSERMFGELNPKQAEYVDDIHASGRHLHALINDILDLSKIEAGRMELELAPFDLPTAVRDALTLVHERASRHGIEVKVNIDERLGSFVADERKFKQILLNLLSNAFKFTARDGSVTVTAALTNPGVEISVADTGIGIASADQEVIFDEFRQLKSDTARREGTGLGLALTRKFVEMHGGKIRVESEVGKGSVFTFSLPAHS
jgi:signal transduction histidine kinase/HAMP domain-containing protein